MSNQLRHILLMGIVLLFSVFTQAQVTTGASGVVVDAETGETLPAVQIYFIAVGNKTTGLGTTSDYDGLFNISNTKGYISLRFQMMGYKVETITLTAGRMKSNLTVRLTPESYTMQEVVVKPKKEKDRYRRKGNPAVELIKNVIAHKDSANVKTIDHYTAESYSRMSFALDNFHPDFSKRFWRNFAFAEKYIDTTTESHSMTIDVREQLSKEYYTFQPKREKHILEKKRIFGVEDIIGAEGFQKNIDLIFKDIDINNNNMNLLFNRFVSPLSSSLAVSFYQYYIMDTILVDGEECIDLAFVPVNSESYSFTGHLYIVNDSTFKVKQYKMNIPKNINLNFVDNYAIEHTYKRMDNGLWAPDRTTTGARFYLFSNRYGVLARQTKIYTNWDMDSSVDTKVFSSLTPSEIDGPESDPSADSLAVRLGMAAWDTIRPEPLTWYETSVYDLVEEFEANPLFNSLTMFVNAITTEYIPTAPGDHMWDSKWDFGPIYNTFSWNPLEGFRLRIGGLTTANVNPHWFFQGYVAFGTTDLRPKYNASVIYSFTEKKYHPYESLRHYLLLRAQYDVEEPCQETGVIRRDHILMSIPTSKPSVGFNQYVFHTTLEYLKEWQNKFTLRAAFDFSHNEAAGALRYSRVENYDLGNVCLTREVPFYNCYDLGLELRYTPGSTKMYVDRGGNESPFSVDHDAPILKLSHHIGYLDDRMNGGKGYLYNTTEASLEKRFWFSAFGHLDTRLNIGYCWNQVPFTKLYAPQTSTSIFLAQKGFNLMNPMEFMMDRYIGLYATYYFKGWVINRIPYLNRLKLRGVVSFAGVYGYLGKRNNPYLVGNEGLYTFPESAQFDQNNMYLSGRTSSPIGALPYMEVTAGIENILKFIRIDYVRRITYNEYQLPDGIHTRKIGAWGRNGVKVTVRFSL